MPLPRFLELLPQPVWLWLIVTALASWRLTLIIHQEKIGRPLRTLVGIVEYEDGTKSYPAHFLGQLFECFMCLSVWVAVLSVAVLFVFPLALLPFAISALAIFMQLLIIER